MQPIILYTLHKTCDISDYTKIAANRWQNFFGYYSLKLINA